MSIFDDFGSMLTGGPAKTYQPVAVKVGAAPTIDQGQGAAAIQQAAATQQGRVGRQALGMASGRGSEAGRLAAISAGGQGAADIGAGAVAQRQQLFQQIAAKNAEMTQQGQLTQAQLQTQAGIAAQGNTAASDQEKMKQTGALAQSAVGGLSSAVGLLSDERKKKDIRPASDEDIAKALHEASGEFDGVRPISYRYREETGLPTDRRIGIRAQDFEHTGAVEDTPAGKQIDVSHALGLALAAASDLHDRVDALENRKGKGKRRG